MEDVLRYDNPEREPGIGSLTEVHVLENSFVKYRGHFGSDSIIVDSARLSYNDSSKGEGKDKKLLRYLLKNKHTSPFEQVNISFQIRMPIFVMRQFVRHRTFRLNEMSARYTELDLGFYTPEKLRAQDTKNKQGSIQTDDINHEHWRLKIEAHNTECFQLYQRMLEHGVAREMARMVLPLNALTEIIVNIDLSNLIKYFVLRDDNHAQWEHQEIARAMKMITWGRFPWIGEMYEELRAK